jgi:hypothetical protein
MNMTNASMLLPLLTLLLAGCRSAPLLPTVLPVPEPENAYRGPVQLFTVHGKPQFVQDGDFTNLRITDNKRSWDLGWGYHGMSFFPVTLDTNQTYTFTMAEKPFHGSSIPELRRVLLGGTVLYDREICEVHKKKMVHKEAPIAYGLMLPDPEDPSGEIERRMFPHRYEISFGGCVITPRSPKTEKIYFCSECKKAFAKWRSEKGKPAG